MIEHKELALVKPVIKFKSEFLFMLEEYRAVAEDPYRDILKAAWTDFHMYIRQLEDFSKGRGLPHSYAPMTSFWMVQDGKVIVGESRLRHKLTPALELDRLFVSWTEAIAPHHPEAEKFWVVPYYLWVS